MTDVISPIIPIGSYIPPYMPLSNITPFTYRDGLTYLEVLECLRTYVNTTLVDFVNTNFGILGDDFSSEVNTLIETVNTQLDAQTTTVNDALASDQATTDTKIADLTTLVNNAVTEVINSAINLQDSVLSGIVTDTESESRVSLDGLYGTKVNQDSLLNDVGNGGYLSSAVLDTRYLRNRVIDVKDSTYGALGDGVADDTTALQNAINAAITTGLPLNIPSGVYLTDALTVANVNNFALNMNGRFKRKNASTRAPIITFSSCTNVNVSAIRTDGNVVNNNYNGFAVDEAKHDITIDNCARVIIGVIDSINPSGDTLYFKGGVGSSSSNIQIGMVSSISDNPTGRNAVSIIKGQDIEIGQILSINTGHPGQTSPFQVAMPGGLDIEPNSATDLVNGVTIGQLRVKTAGSSGFNIFSVYGQIITNVSVGNVITEKIAGTLSAGIAGVIRGAQHVKVDAFRHDSHNYSNGFSVDDSTDIRVDINVSNIVGNGVSIGASNLVDRFRLSGSIESVTAHGIAIYTANNGNIDMRIKNVGAPNMCVAKLAGTTSNNILFKGDWSKDVSGGNALNIAGTITRWILDGVDFTGWAAGTRIAGVGAGVTTIVKRSCPNLNFLAAVPNFDTWSQGDVIWNTTPAAAGVPGWVCVTGGVPGSGAIFKAMAAVAA